MDKRGFTLIELVVAMGILTILYTITILAPLNNVEKEIMVIESQVESVLYSAIVHGNATVENMIIEYEDRELILKDKVGFEIQKEKIVEGFELGFENTKTDKKISVEKGYITRQDNSKPIEIVIRTNKAKKEYKFTVNAVGGLKRNQN